MEYLGEKFYTSVEFLRAIKGLSQKMFAYLRDTIRLIPSPIKTSRGRGVVAFYPQCALDLMKRVMKERAKNLTYREIKEQFSDDIKAVFLRSDSLRSQYESEKEYIKKNKDILTAGIQPGDIIKKKEVTLKVDGVSADKKLQEMKKELKVEFQKWNGKDTMHLHRIKHRIEKIDKLEAVNKYAKALSWGNVKSKGGQSGQKQA